MANKLNKNNVERDETLNINWENIRKNMGSCVKDELELKYLFKSVKTAFVMNIDYLVNETLKDCYLVQYGVVRGLIFSLLHHNYISSDEFSAYLDNLTILKKIDLENLKNVN